MPAALHGFLITWMLFSEGSTNRDDKKLLARRSAKKRVKKSVTSFFIFFAQPQCKGFGNHLVIRDNGRTSEEVS